MSNKKKRKFGLQRLGNIPRSEFTDLEQLPNVGPATARYFKRVGVSRPVHLVGRDPYALYEELCRVAGVQYDPCLLDQFISAVRFMDGETAAPWWEYTTERKRTLALRRFSIKGAENNEVRIYADVRQ
jgi:hypothetical protein